MNAEKQKTILLVEDEAIIAMSEKMTLENFGYRVRIAHSGDEAIAAVAATPAIDLILMDINLGAGIDGTEAAEIILQEHDIPIVFLSSHTEPEIIARTERITAYGFVVKNSSATVFQALIKMVFKLYEAKAREKKKECQGTDAPEALRESKERFHSFYVNSNAGIYRTAPDGTIQLANPALVRMLGYLSFADLADRDLNETGFEPSYPRAQFVARIERDGEVKGLESVWKRKDGGTIIVRENARAIRDAQGKTLFYDGIVEDVTDFKRSEKLTETLYGISQAIYSADDLDELYRRIHGLIAAIVPADNFFIAQLSDDGQALTFPYNIDEKDTGAVPVIAADDPQSLTVEVLGAKQPLLLNEAQLRERYATGRNRVWGTAPKCWLGVPLLVKDKAIGVMVIQDYSDGNAYSQGDVLLLESTAGQIAIAIDRKRAEKALRQSMESFKGYFNMGTVGMCVTSPGKGWIEVNDCLCRMLGYTREELLRLTWDEMTHADDLNTDLDLFNQVLAGERDTYQLEKRFIRKDGQVISTLLYVTCQRHPDGSVHLILASLVDISERKQVEAALAQERFLMQALMNNVPDYLYFKDRDSRFLRINKAHARSFALDDPVQAVGKSDFDFFTEEHARQAFEDEQAIMRTERLLSKEERETRPGRPDTWVLTTKMPLRDAGGNIIGTFGISRDITGRKQAEEEIKRQLAEKEILLKEVHHRIKNNIATIGGLITLRLKSIASPEAVAVLQDAIGRIDSMRLLYDKLLLDQGYEDLSVKNYVESLADTIVTLFPDNARITVDKRIADFHLDAKRMFPLGLIINELITNKMKYSFIDRDAGLLEISLTNAAGRVTLAIQDNGITLPEGFDIEQSKGFGLMLVKMLSHQLGGSFSMARQAGTRCVVEFNV